MFSNKRNMNFNFFTVSTFNQRWMSGYYKIIARCNSFIDEASPAGMKTPGGRSSSLKNSDSASESWRGNIDESVINSPQSQFTTERNGQWSSRYFWEMLNFKFLALFTVHLLIFSIFPYLSFLQGTCSKRNCAVLHTTLQI